MEVTGVRPNYSATKKGGLIGAGTSIVAGAGLYGIVSATTLPLRKGVTNEAKRVFITQFSEQYSKLGIDMSKTTVSKIIKGAKTALKNPVTVGMGIAAGVLIGAGIGFVVDKVKNTASKQVKEA